MKTNDAFCILRNVQAMCLEIRREKKKQMLRYVYELHNAGMKYKEIAELLPDGTKPRVYFYYHQAERLNRMGFLYNKSPLSTNV